MKDYYFKFDISESVSNYTHFNDFMKDNILDMLAFCDFYNETGDKVDIKSFKIKHPGEHMIALYDNAKERISANSEYYHLTEDEKALDSTEPRISYIIKVIKNLEALVDLITDGENGNVKSIGLKDCKQWLLHERNHASSVYQNLAYTCNANCQFCYLLANPDNIRIGKKYDDCSYQELMTRIKYFEKDSDLFSTSYEIKEFFNSPHFKETLIELRKKTDDQFFFVTNGSLLTENIVQFLSTVMPVVLIVSVIVVSNDKRKEIMLYGKSTNEQIVFNNTVVESFSLLKKYKVPFIGSITAWPSINYDDFLETIHFLEKYEPVAIRINMLGYTEKNRPKVPVEDDFWRIFCEYIEKASKETAVPLLPIPSQFYINEFQDDVLDIKVLGIVKNSPADGVLKNGDIIKRINGINVTSRDQLLEALNLIKGEKTLTIKRDEDILDLKLNEKHDNLYPFCGSHYGKYNFPYGIVIPEGIQLKQIKQLIQLIQAAKAKYPLLVTGPLELKTVISFFEKLGAYVLDIDIDSKYIKFPTFTIKVVCSNNYYLQGNMKIMDMCVASDLLRVIDETKEHNTDLVLLPDSMFNCWGNDLVGVNKDMFINSYDIPIVFLNSKTVPY